MKLSLKIILFVVAVWSVMSFPAFAATAAVDQGVNPSGEGIAGGAESVDLKGRQAVESMAREAVERVAKEAVQQAAEAAAKAAAEAAANRLVDQKAEAAAAKEAKAEARAEARETQAQIDSKVFRLNHASAIEVAERLNEMWNGEFGQVWKVTKMAVAFPESNSILVTAPRLILGSCEKAISALDVEAPQVYIEARFVELSNNASHKLGIDWQMLDGMQGSLKLGGGTEQSRLGKGVADYSRSLTDGQGSTSYKLTGSKGVGGKDGDITYFNGTLDFSEMYLVLRALESAQDARVFSNPKIIVSSGKKAVVDMTTKYPNVTVAAKRTLNGNSESLDLDMKMTAIPGEDKFMFAKEAFFSWGIQLEVTPRIGTNGLINVTIVPTISSQSDWVTAGSDTATADGSYSSKYPVIDVQRLVTEFNMASETTAVIGGLSRTTETQKDNGIPFLRDCPWIGPKLFGSKIRVKEQKEIIVFVTVGLVNPREMREDAGLPKNAVLGRQFTEGYKLEPGDRPLKGMEGIESLDLRPLDEQAHDPLNTNVVERTSFLGAYAPFMKNPGFKATKLN